MAAATTQLLQIFAVLQLEVVVGTRPPVGRLLPTR